MSSPKPTNINNTFIHLLSFLLQSWPDRVYSTQLLLLRFLNRILFLLRDFYGVLAQILKRFVPIGDVYPSQLKSLGEKPKLIWEYLFQRQLLLWRGRRRCLTIYQIFRRLLDSLPGNLLSALFTAGAVNLERFHTANQLATQKLESMLPRYVRSWKRCEASVSVSPKESQEMSWDSVWMVALHLQCATCYPVSIYLSTQRDAGCCIPK